MKRYYNQTTKEWYTEGQSVTKYIDGSLFSGIPSVEQLESWGFEEYIEPTPTPEELLARAKANKIAELEEALQKLTDQYVKKIDAAVEEKSKEIMTV